MSDSNSRWLPSTPMKLPRSLPTTPLITAALALALCAPTLSQSGKGTPGGRRIASLNVIVHAPEGRLVTRDDLDLYDAGVSQEIESFTKLDTGSRIVLAIDDSENLKAEPALIQKAAHAIVDELYQDDEMMIVGFAESAIIIEDTTGDLEKLQGACRKLARKGSPNLFDAI